MSNPTFENLRLSEADIDKIALDHPDWFVCAQKEADHPGIVSRFGQQDTAVNIVHPSQGSDPERDGVVVIPRSYEAPYAYLRGDKPYDLEAKRDAVIANVLGKTVVGVDTPGFGMNPGVELSKGQILSGAVGSMVPHARVQLEAIVAALRREGIYDARTERQLKLDFLGYSMGNIATVAMLNQLDRYIPAAEVTGLTMVEAVSDQNFNLFGHDGLLAAIGRDTDEANTNRYFDQNARNGLTAGYDRETDDYTQLNPDRASRMSEAKKRGAPTNLAIGMGMWRGFEERLGRELQRHEVSAVDIVRTNGSEVARRESNLITAQNLARLANVNLTTIMPGEDGPDHHHPFWQSFPAVAATIHNSDSRRR